MPPPIQSAPEAPRKGSRPRSFTTPLPHRTEVGSRLALCAGRSLLPLVALLIVLGTFVWGPWVTLGLTAAWWMAVTRWA